MSRSLPVLVFPSPEEASRQVAAEMSLLIRERAAEGKFVPGAIPSLVTAEGGAEMVDGGNGLGMPAFRLATERLLGKLVSY